MQNLDGWKRFERTGRIMDYLMYKQDDSPVCEVSEELSVLQDVIKQQGEKPHAGICKRDGNDLKTDAGGRV